MCVCKVSIESCACYYMKLTTVHVITMYMTDEKNQSSFLNVLMYTLNWRQWQAGRVKKRMLTLQGGQGFLVAVDDDCLLRRARSGLAGRGLLAVEPLHVELQVPVTVKPAKPPQIWSHNIETSFSSSTS